MYLHGQMSRTRVGPIESIFLHNFHFHRVCVLQPTWHQPEFESTTPKKRAWDQKKPNKTLALICCPSFCGQRVAQTKKKSENRFYKIGLQCKHGQTRRVACSMNSNNLAICLGTVTWMLYKHVMGKPNRYRSFLRANLCRMGKTCFLETHFFKRETAWIGLLWRVAIPQAQPNLCDICPE